MRSPCLSDRAVPRPGDRVIWINGPDFTPARICEISPSGRMIGVEFPGGGSLFAPAAGFLAVPESYLPPPPRYLTEIQQVELMYDSEIPAGVLDAAERRDAAREAIAAQRTAAAWLAWLSAHLYPLDPLRFAAHQERARAALAVAAPAALTAAA
jgi:hypothetical protein